MKTGKGGLETHIHSRHRINGKGDLETTCGILEPSQSRERLAVNEFQGLEITHPGDMGGGLKAPWCRDLETITDIGDIWKTGWDGGRQERQLGSSFGGWYCASLPPPPLSLVQSGWDALLPGMH